MEVDFKIYFDAPDFDETEGIIYTAKFILGNIEWDESDKSYLDVLLYAFADKEAEFSFPALADPDSY